MVLKFNMIKYIINKKGFCASLSYFLLILLILLLNNQLFASITIENLDNNIQVGCSIDLIGTNAYISYHFWNMGDLRMAKHTASGWQTEDVDTSTINYYNTSIAIDSNGNPHIAYCDWGWQGVKYAKWNGSSWDIEEVAAGDAAMGHRLSLALDGTNPHIAYYDHQGLNNFLSYAKKVGTNWVTEVVYPNNISDHQLSLDLLGTNACIVFRAAGKIIFAKHTPGGWITNTVSGGTYPSIKIDNTNIYVSYSSNSVYLAKWTNNVWQKQIAASNVQAVFSSLDIYNNTFHISFEEFGGKDLLYAQKMGTKWNTIVIDTNGTVGAYSDVAYDGIRTHFCYIDFGNDILKYAKYTPDKPLAPTNFIASVISHFEIDLIWNDLLNETSYTLYRNTDNNTNTLVNIVGLSADHTNYNDISLNTNTTYYYWVKAYNNRGGSAFSIVASNITLPTPSLPITPTIISINAISYDQIDLVWNRISNAESYTLFSSITNDTNTAITASGLPFFQTNYSDITLNPDTTYFYWLKAYNISGESGYSTVVSNTTLPAPPPPSNPIINSINVVSYRQIDIVWSNVTNETSYKLFRNIVDNTDSATNIAAFLPDQTNYYDTNLNPNTTYYYWVKAYNGPSVSAFSPTVSGTTFGGFSSSEIEPEPGWGINYGSLSWGDYDNDGDLDLAIVGNDGSGLRFRVYKNNGDGTFDPNEIEPEPGWGVDWGSLSWGDYDNDGDLDLAVTGDDGSTGIFRVYKNNGDGTFDPNEIEPEPGWGVAGSWLAWGDYDNDGDLDIAIAGWNGARFLRIYKNNGDGTFDPNEIEPEPGWGVSSGCAVEYADYDNDGDLDIAVLGNSTCFKIFKNNGDGTFDANEIEPEPGEGVIDGSLAWGDYDGDGYLDIAVIGFDLSGYWFRIYMNNGDGTFDPNEIELEPGWGVAQGSVACGDYDNDGDLDLAVMGTFVANRAFRIYKNNGDGSFNPVEIAPEPGWGAFRGSLAWADYDNDGDLDIAIAGQSTSGRIFRIYKNFQVINNPPSIPSGRFATNINGNWRLCWNQSADDHTQSDLIRYQIAIGTSPGLYNYASTNIDFPRGQGNLGKVTIITGKPYYQTKISISNIIYWKVCAIDTAFIYSDYSVEQTNYPFPPSAPQFISAIPVSANQIDLVWNDVSIETSYTLFRNMINDTNSMTNIAVLVANVTNYSDSVLLPSTTYYYWVKAYNPLGGSSYSIVISNTTFPPPPDIPVIINMQALSTNQMVLKWTDVSNETSYTLFRNSDNNTNTTLNISGFSSNQTNYNDTGLTPNIFYYYWVKAYNGPSASAYSLVASNIAFPTAPEITDIKAITSNQFNIEWNRVPNVFSYTLFRNTINNLSNAFSIAGLTGNITNYDDIGLNLNTNYYYWVKSYNLSGESIFSTGESNILSLPSTPGWLHATVISANQIDLIWGNILNETSYTLFRNTINDSNTSTNITGFIINQTNYSDTGLKPDTLYYYWIKANNSVGDSGFSEVASNTTLSLPSIPGWLTAVVISDTQIDLLWDSVLNETSYTLFRNTANDTNTALRVTGTVSDETNYSDTGLESGTIYYYWVKAYNSNGSAGFSPVAVNATSGLKTLFSDDFSTDRGWTGYGTAAEWERGPATFGGGGNGYPDPASDHSPTGDDYIIGNDIGGAYNDITGTFWLTSPVINCEYYTNIQFSFWRYLNIANTLFANGYISVFDGTTWINIWSSGATVYELDWSFQNFNVSAYANNNANFRIRFGLGSTWGLYCSGWNIDDVMITGIQSMAPPITPAWLSATSVSTGQINLKWQNASFATSYTLFKNTANNTNTAVKITGTTGNVTNYSDIGLSTSTVYYYWVKSYNILGESLFSTVASEETFPPPPNTPAITGINVVLTNRINLVWNNVLNETTYTLFRSTSNNTNTAVNIAGFSTNQTNYSDIGLNPNFYYYYWVIAYNGRSPSSYSIVASNIPFPTPPSKINTQAVSTNQINITWNMILNTTSYTLYKNTVNNVGTASNVAGISGNQTNYNDIGLKTNTTYYYWIKAYNQTGESIFSSVSSNTTFPISPATPVITLISANSTDSIIIQWDIVTNATSYQLFINVFNNTNTAFFTGTFPTNWTIQVTSLNPNTYYYFWVKAYNGPNPSPYSAVASNITYPTPPGVISIQTISTSQLNIAWNSIANAVSYTLFRSMTNNSVTAVSIAGFQGNNTNHNDIGLTPETIYYYWIKAYNAGGDSIFSLVTISTTFSKDKTPPVTTANIDSGMYVGEVSVVLTAIDIESGVEKIYYTIDSSNPKTSSQVKSGKSPLTIKLAEPTTLKFYAKNNDGYSETVKTKVYEILKAPEDDVMVYNNYLDLSTEEPARIVFGKSGKVEINIYTFRGVLVKNYPELQYNIGDVVEWDGLYMDTDNKVASGVYIAVIIGDIEKKMKIIVKN